MKIIACGCSWTYGCNYDQHTGTTLKEDDYGQILAKKLDAEYINLAVPGASTFFIAKQVEFALSLKPDLILFNTTTHHRFDYVDDTIYALDSEPSLKDFKYTNTINSYTQDFKGSIVSQTYSTFAKVADSQNRTDFKEMVKFLLTYFDDNIKKSQDMLMVKGVLNDLKHQNVPYLCLDFTWMLPETEPNVVKFPVVKLVEKFPLPTDKLHFSSEGHEYIANILYNKILEK